MCLGQQGALSGRARSLRHASHLVSSDLFLHKTLVQIDEALSLGYIIKGAGNEGQLEVRTDNTGGLLPSDPTSLGKRMPRVIQPNPVLWV